MGGQDLLGQLLDVIVARGQLRWLECRWPSNVLLAFECHDAVGVVDLGCISDANYIVKVE